MQRKCKSCGKVYDEACGYCPFCGSKEFTNIVTFKKCPKCGNNVRKEAEICAYCGHEFEVDKAPEIVTLDDKSIASRKKVRHNDFGSLSNTFSVLGFLSIIGVLIATVVFFVYKQWGTAIVYLLLGIVEISILFGLSKMCNMLDTHSDSIDDLKNENETLRALLEKHVKESEVDSDDLEEV